MNSIERGRKYQKWRGSKTSGERKQTDTKREEKRRETTSKTKHKTKGGNKATGETKGARRNTATKSEGQGKGKGKWTWRFNEPKAAMNRGNCLDRSETIQLKTWQLTCERGNSVANGARFEKVQLGTKSHAAKCEIVNRVKQPKVMMKRKIK